MTDVDLVALVRWPERACRDEPVATFYGGDTFTARAICATCPIRLACIAAALDRAEWEDHGIWGGTTPRQRRAMRRKHRSPLALGGVG